MSMWSRKSAYTTLFVKCAILTLRKAKRSDVYVEGTRSGLLKTLLEYGSLRRFNTSSPEAQQQPEMKHLPFNEWHGVRVSRVMHYDPFCLKLPQFQTFLGWIMSIQAHRSKG